jgi:hypothetical protein
VPHPWIARDFPDKERCFPDRERLFPSRADRGKIAFPEKVRKTAPAPEGRAKGWEKIKERVFQKVLVDRPGWLMELLGPDRDNRVAGMAKKRKPTSHGIG